MPEADKLSTVILKSTRFLWQGFFNYLCNDGTYTPMLPCLWNNHHYQRLCNRHQTPFQYVHRCLSDSWPLFVTSHNIIEKHSELKESYGSRYPNLCIMTPFIMISQLIHSIRTGAAVIACGIDDVVSSWQPQKKLGVLQVLVDVIEGTEVVVTFGVELVDVVVVVGSRHPPNQP